MSEILAASDPITARRSGAGATAPIPVFLLSGFLGAGKSTLLNEFLSDPAVKDTAVIINEFGDVPVDHLLVRQGETTIQQVSTGCLYCAGTTDLHQTLNDLQQAVLQEKTGNFSRVIVEMSGLGDPAPLINTLTRTNNGPGAKVDDPYYLAGVITLFDVLTGANAVENHFEALKQIAFADRIVLTKSDLAASSTDARTVSLQSDLRSLNASADILDRQAVSLADLFTPRPYSAIEHGEDVVGWLALEAVLAQESGHSLHSEATDRSSRHGKGIRTFSVTSDVLLSEQAFQRFLDLLQRSAGQRLLRVKGIVATQELPEEPLIVHVVQHHVSAPVRLNGWPDADRRTRLVFITDGIDPGPVEELFRAVISTRPGTFKSTLKSAGGALVASLSQSLSTLTFWSRRSR